MTSLRRLSCLFAVFVLTACVEKQPTEPPGSMTPAERTECQMKGGTAVWGGTLVGEATETCIMPPPDQGKSCQRASDCSDVCSAKTRTCTSKVPGENTILDGNGNPVTGMYE